MKKLIYILILLLALTTSISCSKDQQLSINLTEHEKEWLDNHPVIYYAADPEFAPYEYFEDGIYKGIISDYLKLIEDKLGVEIIVVDSPSWSNSLELGRNNEVDFMFMTKTAERKNYFYFTDSFLNSPNVILVNDTSDNKFDISKIENYNLGILREYSSTEYLKLVYPSSKTTEFSNIIDGLLELSYGNIDAFLVDLGQASYYINQLNINHLSINDDINFEYKFSFSIPKENMELLPILNKMVASISENEHIIIRDKWIQSQYKDWLNKDKHKIIYILLFSLIIVVAVISMWTIMLRHTVNQKTNELEMLNSELETRVEERTVELSNLNYELEASLERLMETQEQLLQSKKYEALGKLISGVANEINTPLGNAITSISYSHRIIRNLEHSIKDNTLDKEKLLESIDDLYSSNSISNDNLNKASLIISKFKLLEISRLTKNTDLIDLKTIINLTIDNMIYKNLITSNVEIKLNIADDISLRSPVSWIQEISTNLILNSIQHNKKDSVTIQIRAKKLENESIIIVFEDPGIGISDNDQKRVFDPFYTLKNSNENIGLGLSIIYNIIVSNLYGTIRLDSKYGKYAKFTIALPKQQ
ncbi:MAG: transporter substrate-binding domain-containing protein [Acidaminobacteraceae bacterium]